MNKGNLLQALPIVAAAYGRKFGVKVQVGGTQALTDGETIRIPSIDDTPDAKTLAWGYLTHEAAHVRHTDFAAFTATARHGALVKHVMNVLEDVRIEAAMIRAYPGTAATLWAVEAFLIREGYTRPAQPTDRPVQIMAGFLYTHCRRRFLRWDGLDALARQDAQVLRTTFPPSFIHRLLGLLAEVPEDSGHVASVGTAGDDDGGRAALQAVLCAGAGKLPEDPFQTVAKALSRHATGHSTLLLPTLENYGGHALRGQTALSRVRSESAKLTARLQGLV